MRIWKLRSIKNVYDDRRKAGLAAYVLLFGLFISLWLPGLAQAAEEGQPDIRLYAKSAVLMDAKSGRVLYEKNGYEHMPNASTTKIMTCILTLELGNLEDEVSISSYAASMPKVRLGMRTEIGRAHV